MLKKRLAAIYDLVNTDASFLVDVGADHAFLSIELIKNKKALFVTNIEINKSPLESGLLNVKKNKLENQINFYLNDGFKNLKFDKKIDYVCISGMGGSNIVDIISNNKNDVDYYILQANNDVPLLRKFLFDNSFQFINELIIKENHYFYEILKVKKTTNKIEYNNDDLYIGPIFKMKQDHLFHEYLLHKNAYFSKIYHDKISNKLKLEINTIRKFLNA